MQLTPARRLFYSIALAGFVVGLVRRDLLYLIGSFLLINFLLAMELVDKLTTRDELEIAREIQLSLLPDHIPQPRDAFHCHVFRTGQDGGRRFF